MGKLLIEGVWQELPGNDQIELQEVVVQYPNGDINGCVRTRWAECGQLCEDCSQSQACPDSLVRSAR